MNTSCILTVIKNEHEYLDEWIRYHLNLGIDHIFIFEDIGSDSHERITNKYDKVTLLPITSILSGDDKNKVIKSKTIKSDNHNDNPQYIYIRKGLSYLKTLKKYDWCFVIDNDEFITLENNNLQNVISLFNDYDAFIMQWKCYGANGLVNKPNYKDKGIVETYTKEIQGYVPSATPQSLTKTCYNLNTYQENYFLYTHQPSKYCNFCRTNFTKNRNKPVFDKIYIRHYITKSWEEYVWKMKSRGYFFGKLRTCEAFFKINPDMNYLKENLMNEEILVVMPYKYNGAQGNEIRLTLTGWKKFCKFKYHFIVIGEFDLNLKKEFPWVEFIYFKLFKKTPNQYFPHIDIQNKFKVIYEQYHKIYDGFIWICDDYYPIKPFNIDDIKRIYYRANNFTGNEKSPVSYWSHDKWKTKQLLNRENLPHYNYTIHYPCYFEFNKINEIWKKFNMFEESYVVEDIYFNYFKHGEPIKDDEIRLGIWNNKIYKEEFQKALDNPNIKFVTNSVEGWSKELENKLSEIVDYF